MPLGPLFTWYYIATEDRWVEETGLGNQPQSHDSFWLPGTSVSMSFCIHKLNSALDMGLLHKAEVSWTWVSGFIEIPWSNIIEQYRGLWYPCHQHPVLLTGFGVIFLCSVELNWVSVCELSPSADGTSAFRIRWSIWPWLTGKSDCGETSYCRLRTKWSWVILSPFE